MKIKAVIFDLDGVIVDTAEHHYRAWKRLVEELGIPCPPERKDQVRGISRTEALKIVLAGREASQEEAQQLASRKDTYYREMIRTIGPSDLLPGVRSILETLKKTGIGIAVATVSRKAWHPSIRVPGHRRRRRRCRRGEVRRHVGSRPWTKGALLQRTPRPHSPVFGRNFLRRPSPPAEGSTRQGRTMVDQRDRL